jgi:hypothetical protein
MILTIAALLGLGLAAGAQPLPQLTLKPVLTKLTDERPVWMSEAPDGSGRLFVVYQAGKILVTKKGSDGGDAKVFFDITDREPNFDNEDGLLSLAFHPGFATNHLFYVYYNQKNPDGQHTQPLNFPYRSVISEFQGLRHQRRRGRPGLRAHPVPGSAALRQPQGRRTLLRARWLSLSRPRRRRRGGRPVQQRSERRHAARQAAPH